MSIASEQLENSQAEMWNAIDDSRMCRSAIKDAIANLRACWEANQPTCPAEVQGVIEDLEGML